MQPAFVLLETLSPEELVVTFGGMMEYQCIFGDEISCQMQRLTAFVARLFSTSSDNSYVCAKVGYCG